MTLSFDQKAHAEPAAIAVPHQQRLPSGLREEFAAHFGADFDDIRISPTAAAPAVTANGTDAMTVGNPIAFGDTAYQSESGWGRELIAHELAHVVQQRGSTGGPSDPGRLAYELATAGFRPKLKVDQPGDVCEQEADEIADRVMRSPAGEASGSRGGECCSGCASGTGCSRRVQRQAASAGSLAHGTEVSSDTESRIRSGGSAGQPLPGPTRALFEPRFGRDLGDVRVHSGPNAVQLNEDVQAHASTHGSHIWLGSGLSPEPSHVLAHELAHVVCGHTASDVLRGATPGPTVASGAPLHIQRFAGESNGQMDAAPGSVDRALASPGRALEPVLRQDMEQRFNHDFSRVRVHSGPAAEQSARDVNAHAYAVGHDIVFGAGRFAPGTPEGRRLIAHELTHVVQQAGSNASLVRRAPGTTEGTEANVEILGASGSTSETVILYHYGDLEGRDSFNSRPGYPRLTDCDIATNQAEAARYTGAPISDRLRYKYELKIDRVYFEKNFTNNGAPRGAYSEFGTKQSIPTKYFRRVLKLTPAPVAPPARAVSGVIPRPGSGGIGGGRGQLTTVAEAEAETARAAQVAKLPAGVPPAAIREIAQVAKSSGFRTVGRFLARETPGLVLQVLLSLAFPPGVNIHNDKAEELTRTKLDPAVQEALARQAPMVDKLLGDDLSQSIYANVKARFDYRFDASSDGGAELYLKDITFLDMKITNENVSRERFEGQTGSMQATKQVTYSLLLYEPEYVTRARAQQESEEDLRRPGTGAGSRAR